MPPRGPLEILSRRWRKLSFVWKYQIAFWTLESVVSFPVHFVGIRYVLHWQAPLYGIVLLKWVELIISILVTTGFAKAMETAWFRRKRAWARTISICLMVVAVLSIRNLVFIPAVITPIYNLFGHFPRVEDTGERTVKVAAAHTYYFLLYMGWAGIFLLVKASVEAKRKERELHASELKRKEAEILKLRSQLNPHFLFNAMSTIAYESAGNEKIDHLVEGISDYLRYSLSIRTYVSLKEEIDATRRYLEVQAIRLEAAFQFEIDADPAGDHLPVPGVFLQPLAENALKYGGRGTPPPLRIRIVSRFTDGKLEVEVANTGEWVPSVPREKRTSGGLGLENLKERLNLFYPDRFELDIRSEDGWTKVRIVLREPEAAPDRMNSP